MHSQGTPGINRRSFLEYFSAIGLAGTAFPAAVLARANTLDDITVDVLRDAEQVSGLEFSDAERELMIDGLNENLEMYEMLRAVDIPNAVAPAVSFDALRGAPATVADNTDIVYSRPRIPRPSNDAELAFLPVTHLAELIRTRRITSVELTNLYLGRLRQHDGVLQCVITLTEETALRQARRADAELARGHYRGPLHGIPWGAKDLLAARNYPTTWGAEPFREQVIDEDATVVKRLEEAGAVLVAKLTLGALAWGDVWFGGTTKNPWNTEQGSSGSSAGPASATAAGLVGFSIGSETLGSIVSPSTRCGATGLRPTFGAVSRHGAMALSWTMDKLGPICRAVEDCALVFDAIRGADGKDPTARDAHFNWDHRFDPRNLRVGYVKSAFDADHRTKSFDDATLDTLRSLGFDLIPVEMPSTFPVGALRIILSAEAAAAFDKLTRTGRDDLMVRQIENAWPNVFRQARMIPAVEYIQANRVRTMVMGEMASMMEGVDVFVSPSFGGSQLLTTNLTGHPVVVLPNGFTEAGTPVSVSFIGGLFGEAQALSVARAYQEATDFNGRIPPGFG